MKNTFVEKIFPTLSNRVDFCQSACYINPYKKYDSISAKDFIVNLKILLNGFLQFIISIVLFEMILFGQEALSKSGTASIMFPTDGEVVDQVSGNLIQFNDNGAWCWYQDERAVIDNDVASSS